MSGPTGDTAHRSGRPTVDWGLYLVTDPVLTAGYGLVRTVVEAIEGGVSVVQLRDGAASDEQFVQIGRQLHAAIGGRVPLIVNDRVHLVAEIGAEGAHVGQGDMDIVRARALLGEDKLLGLSVASPQHIDAARQAGVKVIDYVGVSPIWDTATKAYAVPSGVGVAGATSLAAASPWPAVGIGGISLERVPLLHHTGMDGICVVSAICGQPDPRAAAAALRRAWDARTPAPDHRPR